MLYLNKKNLKSACLITVGGVTMLMLTQLILYKASRGEEANGDLGVGGNDALSKVGLLAVHRPPRVVIKDKHKPTVRPATPLKRTLRPPPSPIGAVVDERNDALSKVGLLAVHGHDIYAEFVNGPSGPAGRVVSSDLTGWGLDDLNLRSILDSVEPRFVVEVGSWKGLSAVTMAKWLKAHNPPGSSVLVCVDTWLGTTKAWLEPEQNGNTLYKRAGYPSVYYQFLYNVKTANVSDVIVPLPLPGPMGALFMQARKAAPDLVFIDGCHDYECVVADVEAWFYTASPSGTLFGDDVARPEVHRALQDVCRLLGATFKIKVPLYFGTTDVFKLFNKHAFTDYDIGDPKPALDRITYFETNQTAYTEVVVKPII